MALQTREIPNKLQAALEINIDALCKANPSQEHNIREEWGSSVGKMTDFYQKFGNGSTSKQ